MGKYIFANVCFLLCICHFAAAISNFYMNEYCGSSINVGVYDQIRLRLTRSSSSYHNTQCTLSLQTDFRSKMMLYFNDMNIQSSGTYCGNNYLEIDDGSSTSEPCLTYSCRQCGYSSPSGVFTSSGSYLTFTFQSDTQYTPASFDIIITSYHTGYCNSDEHTCNNGRCIDDSLTCNGENPCGDHSDCDITLTVGGIAGVAIGGVVFITIIIIAIVVCRRRSRTVIVKQAVPVGVTSSYGYNQPVPNQYAPPPYPGGTANQQGQYQNY